MCPLNSALSVAGLAELFEAGKGSDRVRRLLQPFFKSVPTQQDTLRSQIDQELLAEIEGQGDIALEAAPWLAKPDMPAKPIPASGHAALLAELEREGLDAPLGIEQPVTTAPVTMSRVTVLPDGTLAEGGTAPSP